MPFLLPLMLQVGFGMSPFQSGLITFASAMGAMGMKMAAVTILRRFGFRTILVVNAIISAGFLATCAAFTQATPVAVMVGLLLVGGFFRSLQFTSINTIAYAEIDAGAREPRHLAGQRRPAIVAVGRRCRRRAGGGAHGAVPRRRRWRRADFPPAFLVVAAISALSVLIFARLPPDAGAELANRMPAPTETSDQRAG